MKITIKDNEDTYVSLRECCVGDIVYHKSTELKYIFGGIVSWRPINRDDIKEMGLLIRLTSDFGESPFTVCWDDRNEKRFRVVGKVTVEEE